MALQKYDPYTLPTIDFVGGSTQDLAFHAYHYANNRPFDLFSCDVNFAVISYVNKGGDPLISKAMTVTEGDVDGEAVPNLLTVTLDPEDTVDLTGKFIYQITIKDVSGEVEIPWQGIMRIANNINKSYIGS